MLYPIAKQHKTVAVDLALGKLQIGLFDGTRKQWNTRAQQYWIDLEDNLVDLGKKRRG